MRQGVLGVRGHLTIWDLLPGGGKGRKLVDGKNIITSLGRARIARLITGLSTDFVDQLAIGDGGAPQGDLLTPIVPLLTDTDIVHEVDRTSSVNPVVVGQVLTFTATFLTASLSDPDFINPANKVINEAGLYASDGILFARKTFVSIPFSPGDRVGSIFTWELEVL